MDFWSIFIFFLLTFLIMSCCGYCCTSKRRGAVLSTPVVVTSATHAAPGGYPVTQVPPPGYPANVYAAPYPAQTSGNVTVQMPMPAYMPGAQPPMPAMQTHGAVYGMPQPGAGAANMNPPSYDMAVAGISTGPAQNVGYEKQSPYNPGYVA